LPQSKNVGKKFGDLINNFSVKQRKTETL
jgi:hypothetical protein